MKLGPSQHSKQRTPRRPRRLESLDEELQDAIIRVAADKNMSPQEYLDYITSSKPKTMHEVIQGLDTSQMGTCELEVFLEIMDESRVVG